jgi:hypothetical protein
MNETQQIICQQNGLLHGGRYMCNLGRFARRRRGGA